jgi:cell division protein FtsL
MSIDPGFVQKQDIRNNPVIRDLDPQQRRDFRRTLLLAAAVVAMLLFSAWQHVSVMTTRFSIEQLRRDEAAEVAVQRQLRLEREMRRSPARIESRAIRELHMRPPADTLVIERLRATSPDKAVIAANR